MMSNSDDAAIWPTMRAPRRPRGAPVSSKLPRVACTTLSRVARSDGASPQRNAEAIVAATANATTRQSGASGTKRTNGARSAGSVANTARIPTVTIVHASPNPSIAAGSVNTTLSVTS